MRNFRKIIIRVAVVVLIFAIINQGLNFIFVPYSYVAVDYHNLKQKEYDILYVGTSHGKCGIDPAEAEAVSGKSGVNLCLGGEYPAYTYYMVKQACSIHIPEQIVYEIDGGYWTTDEYIGTDSCSIFGEMDFSAVKAEFFLEHFFSQDFRVTLFPWYNYRKEYRMIKKNISNKLSGVDKSYDTSVFQDASQEYREDGFIYRYPVADEEKGFTNFVEWNSREVREEHLVYFEKLVKFCKEKDIGLTLLITPVPQETYEAYQASYDQEHAYIAALAEKEGLEFLDFNKEDTGDFSKGLESYVDREGHMTGEAAGVFSRELGKKLKEN